MPTRKQPRSVAEQVHEELETEISELVTQIAAEEGPAPNAQYVSADHEVEMWGQMDPSVDYETFVGELMQGTVPPERLDPNGDQPLALIKNHPELAQLFAEPLDQEMASMVATLAEYPFRLSLLAPYTDDPQASVKKADSLTGRWKRKRNARVAQPLPAAQPVPVQAQLTVPPASVAAPLPGPQASLGVAPPPPVTPPPVPALLGPPAAPAGPPGVAPPPLPRQRGS